MARGDKQKHPLQHRYLPWLADDFCYLKADPLFPSRLQIALTPPGISWPSLLKQQELWLLLQDAHIWGIDPPPPPPPPALSVCFSEPQAYLY